MSRAVATYDLKKCEGLSIPEYPYSYEGGIGSVGSGQ